MCVCVCVCVCLCVICMTYNQYTDHTLRDTRGNIHSNIKTDCRTANNGQNEKVAMETVANSSE